MISVDYQYYVDSYKGTLIQDQDAFDECVRKAQDYIIRISSGKYLKLEMEDETNAKDCLCALADYEKREETRIGLERISSESVGGHSRSYNANAVAKDQRTVDSEKKALVFAYLGTTGILYRGV